MYIVNLVNLLHDENFLKIYKDFKLKDKENDFTIGHQGSSRTRTVLQSRTIRRLFVRLLLLLIQFPVVPLDRS